MGDHTALHDMTLLGTVGNEIMKTYHIEVYYDDGSVVWFTAQDTMNFPGDMGRAIATELYKKLCDQFKYVALIETETSHRTIDCQGIKTIFPGG